MGKRDELIAKYADDLKNKCNMTPDMDLLTKVTIGCGPAIYNADASTVAGSQPQELETVKKEFSYEKAWFARRPKPDGGHQFRHRDLWQVRTQQIQSRDLLHARENFR